MAFTADVAAGQKIASTWGNQGIRDRTIQVFATIAERDAQWPSPPVGAHCITVDSFSMWVRRAGFWAPPRGTLVAAESGPIINLATTTGGVKVLGTTTTGTYPYPTRVNTTLVVSGNTPSGAGSFYADMINVSTGAAFPTTGTVYIQPAFYAFSTYVAGWAVPANQSTAATYRVNITSLGGGTFNSSGSYLAEVYAA
jgi:hypothetical protein